MLMYIDSNKMGDTDQLRDIIRIILVETTKLEPKLRFYKKFCKKIASLGNLKMEKNKEEKRN